MRKHNIKNNRICRYIIGATPTTERRRHFGGLRCGFIKADRSPGALVSRYRARWASPLDWYRDKQIIDDAQHHAGLRFGQAYHHAASSEPACHGRARLFNTEEESAELLNSSLIRALDYVKQAHAALSSDTVNVVIDVCAYERPAANPEALSKLRKGLGRLALSWGMASNELCNLSKD